MTQLNLRSGVPRVVRMAFDQNGDSVDLRGVTKNLTVRTSDPIRMYFTQADYDADMNYVDIPGPANSNVWTDEIAVRLLWFRAINASADVEITAALTVGN